MNVVTRFVTLLAFVGWAGAANASVMLDYQGNNFDTFSNAGPTAPSDTYSAADSVAGWIELPDLLTPNLVDAIVVPLTFSFTDGVNELDDSTATTTFFRFSTDGGGIPTDWLVNLSAFNPVVGGGTNKFLTTQIGVDQGTDTLCGPTSTALGCAAFGDPFYFQLGEVQNSPGVWAYKTSQVPSPSTLTLFVLGLLGAGVARGRKLAG